MNEAIAAFFGFSSFELKGKDTFLVRTNKNDAALVTVKKMDTFINYYVEDELIGTVFNGK